MAGKPYAPGQWPPSSTQDQFPPQVPHRSHFASYDFQPPGKPTALFSEDQYQAPQVPPLSKYYGATQSSRAAFEHNTQMSSLNFAIEPFGQRSPNAVGGDLSWSEAFPTAVSADAPFAHTPHNPLGHHANPQQQQYHHPQPFHKHHAQAPQQTVYPPQAYRAERGASQKYDADTAAIPRRSEPEEGELSDDDEDPYEPEETSRESEEAMTSCSPTSQDPENGTSQLTLEQNVADLPSRDASVIDTQDDAFYDDEDEDMDEQSGGIKSKQNSRPAPDAAIADEGGNGFPNLEPKSLPRVAGERTESHSPSLSSGGVQKSNDVAEGELQSVRSAAARASPNTRVLAHLADSKRITNGNKIETSQDPSAVAEESASATKLPYSSVDDAKKEAQRAILRLIPYGVNYQTYIDEGFDRGLIISLFTDLGLKALPNEPVPMQRSISPVEEAEVTASQSEPAGDGGTTKKEERKDRIARLLALRASKSANLTVIESSVATPTPVATPKSNKARSKNALLLQQRLAALKQAQEQRAAAAAKAAAQSTTLDVTWSGQQSQAAAADLGPKTDKDLTVTTAPSPAPPGSSRQQPVAADIVDSSPSAIAQSPHSPPKRPHELTRQRSSIIIEVSDDSADEDIAMEIDSQADGSAMRAADLSDRHGEGLQLYDDDMMGLSTGIKFGRDTLSDSPHLSPRLANGQETPPVALASMLAQPSDDEYARKMREIEQMKRRIAEAVAKKANGSPTRARTPQMRGQQTPPDNGSDGKDNLSSSNSGVASLAVRSRQQPLQRTASASEVELLGKPKASSLLASTESVPTRQLKRIDIASPAVSGEDHRAKRMRMGSLQLPSIEANLREKMFKLRLLQDKVAALQAEIDAGVAEKQRLTEDADDVARGSDDSEGERDARLQPILPSTAAQAGHVLLNDTEQDDKAVSDVTMRIEMDVSTGVAEQAGPGVGSDVSQADGVDPADESAAGCISVSAGGSVAISDASPPHEPDFGVGDDDIEMVKEIEDEEEKSLEAGVELSHNESQSQREQSFRPASVAEVAPTGVKAGMVSSTFVPYESPLQYFRSYRYHPQYSALVSSGFRSLTYSGKIQDDVALCPTETAGESCREAACRFQHFATIVPKGEFSLPIGPVFALLSVCLFVLVLLSHSSIHSFSGLLFR